MDNVALFPATPCILPIVEQTQRAESQEPSLASLFALGLAQRLQQSCAMTIEEPISLRALPTRLDNVLCQNVSCLLLLPWCLQEQMAEVSTMATAVLQRRAKGHLSTTFMSRPNVPVQGALPAGPFGGFISVQERLDRYVAQLPGWQTTYTCLETEEATLLLPHAPEQLPHGKLVKDMSSLEMALFCVLCPEHPLCQALHLDEALLQDGSIYATYLTALLSAASKRAFAHAVVRCMRIAPSRPLEGCPPH